MKKRLNIEKLLYLWDTIRFKSNMLFLAINSLLIICCLHCVFRLHSACFCEYFWGNQVYKMMFLLQDSLRLNLNQTDSNWLLHPNSDLFWFPSSHCFPPLYFSASNLIKRVHISWHPSAPPRNDVIVPMVTWDPGREGLLVRRGCWLQRADFDHVMDPEIGHQILQARPPGVFPNCTDTNGSRAI